MTRLISALALVMVACSHAAPPPAAPTAVITCPQLYDHILDISVHQVWQQLSVETESAGWDQINRHYQESGKTDRFYRFCNHSATPQKLSCAMQATNLSAINVCFAP